MSPTSDQRGYTPILVALFVLGGGCLPHEASDNPSIPVDLPSEFAETAGSERADDEVEPDRWWEAFGDPELNHLCDEALARNFQMRAAWARLGQAEALASGSGAGLWPQVSAQLDVSRRRQVVVFGSLGRQEFEVNNLGLSVPVSFELDVWNRLGARVRAAGLDVLASRDDVEALAMTVTANVVETWFNLIQQRAARRLLSDQLETNRIYAELLELRLIHGLGNAIDVYQQQQQVEAVEAQLAQVDASEAVARQQLATLIGRVPGSLGEQIGSLPEPTALPPLPPLPRTGLPSHLLLMRPDVRAARRRAAAQDWRVGAAIADQFPAFRFSASIGLASPNVEDLLNSFVWSIGGSLLATALDGGARAAEVRRNQAALRELIAGFGQILITAISEVEAALVQERQQIVNIENLEDQLQAARATLNEARRRYTEGLSDYLPVLTALSASQRNEQAVLAARRALLSQRVQLARALGGSWTLELEPPPPLPGPAESEVEEPEAEQE